MTLVRKHADVPLLRAYFVQGKREKHDLHKWDWPPPPDNKFAIIFGLRPLEVRNSQRRRRDAPERLRRQHLETIPRTEVRWRRCSILGTSHYDHEPDTVSDLSLCGGTDNPRCSRSKSTVYEPDDTEEDVSDR